MMEAVRNGAWAKSGYTAKDYVQDGLIAMWDGIENAGWGVHDPNATVWKDLAGNGHDLVLLNGAHFDASSCVTANRNELTARLEPNGSLPYNTVEVCGFWDSSRGSSGLICFGNSLDDQRMLTASLRTIQVYNGNFWYPIPTERNSPKSTWAAVYRETPTPYVAGEAVTTTPTDNLWHGRDSGFGLSGAPKYSLWNFVGNYYSVRLYSRAMTAEEIAANYAIDKARFNLT